MQLRAGSEFHDLSGIKALAFDLDGTLISSEPVWAAAKSAVAAAHGRPMPPAALLPFVGRSLRAFVTEAMQITDAADKARIIAEIEALAMQRYGAEILPIAGAAALVRALHDAGFRVALCTSASPPAIAVSLGRLGLDGAFEVMVSATTLPAGKPDRCPYDTVIARLGLDPGQVLAVEDALAGVQSAHAAGLGIVAVGAECRQFGGYGCVLCAEDIGSITLE